MLDATRRRKVFLFGSRRDPLTTDVVPLVDGDLPCPWCGAATAENDDHCPGCHHRFG